MTWNPPAPRRIPRGRCHYCACETFETQLFNGLIWKRPVGMTRADEATKDHKIPKFMLRNGIVPADNIVLACSSCNWNKGKMSYEDFLDTFLPVGDGVPLVMVSPALPSSALAVGWGWSQPDYI